jgi:6-phosphogluconolactonase (cycloisomerase 2 family)
MVRYGLDVEAGTLTPGESIELAACVQYAWPHPAGSHLYVAVSSRGPAGGAGDVHQLVALRISPATGALALQGAPISLPNRPIHLSVDASGLILFVAYSNPSAVSAHRIAADRSIGESIAQPPDLDTGIFAHQIREVPDRRQVVLVTRGNDAAGGRPEDPGALKLFRHADGRLRNAGSVAPGGGFGFGPRHLDFHPRRPWVYVSLERQNRLQMFAIGETGLGDAPLFDVNLLRGPPRGLVRQTAGTVRVHPKGHVVYVANRPERVVDADNRGDSSIVALAIDPDTGEPRPLDYADPRFIHVRSFAIDPNGRLLVAAGLRTLPLRSGEGTIESRALLSLFRIADDGRLTFLRSYDPDAGVDLQVWIGIAGCRS